ncbi:hypothetical protein KC366_g35 [Hortaea werneckii]|nr:hypothetical protein KC366_g35 [Hortaea werneckii]
MNVLTIRAKAVVPGVPGVTVRVSVNTCSPSRCSGKAALKEDPQRSNGVMHDGRRFLEKKNTVWFDMLDSAADQPLQTGKIEVFLVLSRLSLAIDDLLQVIWDVKALPVLHRLHLDMHNTQLVWHSVGPSISQMGIGMSAFFRCHGEIHIFEAVVSEVSSRIVPHRERSAFHGQSDVYTSNASERCHASLVPSPPCRSEGGVLRLDTVGSLIRSRLKRLQYEEESQCRLSPAEECVDMDNMDDARTSHSDDQLLKRIINRSRSWL